MRSPLRCERSPWCPGNLRQPQVLRIRVLVNVLTRPGRRLLDRSTPGPGGRDVVRRRPARRVQGQRRPVVTRDRLGSGHLGQFRDAQGSTLNSPRPSARSSTDRAFDYGSKGWGFESLRARQTESPGRHPLTWAFVHPEPRQPREQGAVDRPLLQRGYCSEVVSGRSSAIRPLTRRSGSCAACGETGRRESSCRDGWTSSAAGEASIRREAEA